MKKRHKLTSLVLNDALIDPAQAQLPTASPTFPPSRLRPLWVLVYVVLGSLALQALRLQVTSSSVFQREASEFRIRELPEYAPRGVMLDRTGRKLVENVPATDLVADAQYLPDDLAPLFTLLEELLPARNQTALRNLLQSLEQGAGSSTTMLTDLTHREYISVSARLNDLPGLRLETSATRSYGEGGLFAHVLGYTGKITAEEHRARPNYFLTELFGKAGLERQYEPTLRGEHGLRRVEVNAKGVAQRDLGGQEPTPGENLRLHLDGELQRVASEALREGLKLAKVSRGVVVALDPVTGGVRALISLPTYSEETLARGSDEETIERIFNDPASPLLNRAIQGQYVPGSTFKIAVAAGALEEGVAKPTTNVMSSGGIRVTQWFFPDWKAGGHGLTDLTKALAESVNTYFYTIGGGFEDFNGLGIERLTAWARRLGLGGPTGVDLPGEESGFLPSPGWKETTKNEAWYIGDTYHAAIGQGDILVTPLQIAVMTAVIANGGSLIEPKIVEAILNPDDSVRQALPPVIRAERVLRPDTISAIRSGMRAAVIQGSARGLSGLPLSVAAKTGTAQVGGTESTHAWVTSFTPLEAPELVVVVLLEQGGGGDRFAVPVARKILDWYSTHRFSR